MWRRRNGFTLIELLVVIAIIAILAAILMPVFARARDKAREATCKSNMKQIAFAVQEYLDDWNGCFPDQTSAGFQYVHRPVISGTPHPAGGWHQSTQIPEALLPRRQVPQFSTNYTVTFVFFSPCVPRGRLELPRVSPYAPEAYASTNFAIRASSKL